MYHIIQRAIYTVPWSIHTALIYCLDVYTLSSFKYIAISAPWSMYHLCVIYASLMYHVIQRAIYTVPWCMHTALTHSTQCTDPYILPGSMYHVCIIYVSSMYHVIRRAIYTVPWSIHTALTHSSALYNPPSPNLQPFLFAHSSWWCVCVCVCACAYVCVHMCGYSRCSLLVNLNTNLSTVNLNSSYFHTHYYSILSVPSPEH